MKIAPSAYAYRLYCRVFVMYCPLEFPMSSCLDLWLQLEDHAGVPGRGAVKRAFFADRQAGKGALREAGVAAGTGIEGCIVEHGFRPSAARRSRWSYLEYGAGTESPAVRGCAVERTVRAEHHASHGNGCVALFSRAGVIGRRVGSQKVVKHGLRPSDGRGYR